MSDRTGFIWITFKFFSEFLIGEIELIISIQIFFAQGGSRDLWMWTVQIYSVSTFKIQLKGFLELFGQSEVFIIMGK